MVSKTRIRWRLALWERRATGASTFGAARAVVANAIIAARSLAAVSFRKITGQQAKKIVALTRVHETASRLWLNRDLNHALDDILAGAIELVGADKGNIQILDTKQCGI